MLLNLGLNKFTMKTLFYTLLITVSYSASALCQEFYPLTSSVISYVIDKEKGTKENGQQFTLGKEVKLLATGSKDSLIIKNLKFYNVGYTEARLTFDLKMVNFKSSYQATPGDYFVTLSFYDENKKCLVSSSFTSSVSMVLDEDSGIEYSIPLLTMKIIDSKNFDFSGDTNLAVHQAFFYGPAETAGGIKYIKYVSVSVFHLGAE